MQCPRTFEPLDFSKMRRAEGQGCELRAAGVRGCWVRGWWEVWVAKAGALPNDFPKYILQGQPREMYFSDRFR